MPIRYIRPYQWIFSGPMASYLECTTAQLPGINLSSWLSTEQREAFVQRIAGLTPQAPVSTATMPLAISSSSSQTSTCMLIPA